MRKLLLTTMVATSVGLTGCAGLAVGSAVVAGGALASTLHDRRTPGVVIDDRTLQAKIIAKLLQDPIISSCSHTNVVVYNGRVLVTGEAKTEEVARRIVQTVSTVPNIRVFEKDISIGQPTTFLNRSNDAVLTGKIKAALLSLRLPNFDPTLINVTTERGNVYLMGMVTTQEADAIAQVASQIVGVRSVVKLFDYISA